MGVQRACYRCGVSLEDQAPFCPSCGAAQIRVTTEQQNQEQPQPILAPGATPDSLAPSTPSQAPIQVQPSGPIQSKSFLPTALPLAFLASLASLWFFPFGLLVLVAAVALGTLHHQRRYADSISAGIGARHGALMGVLTYAFVLLLETLLFALTLLFGHKSGEIREEMIKQIQQMAARTADAQAQAVMRWFATNEGLIVLVGLGLVFLFIVFLAAATAAGAVVGAVANKVPQNKPQ
jgi:hypothetical protein